MGKPPCEAHGIALAELNIQINGKDGEGGLMQEIKTLKTRVDSLHTKFTFGIGFITAIQFLIPWLYPAIAKALNL